MPLNDGIYFLANDAVEEYAIAFLNSLRKFNSHIPVCLIPYNKASRRIPRLASRYDFTVYQEEAYLRYCDGVGRLFCRSSQTHGAFRKLALWNGPFENFIYLDVDTVVFKDLSFLFSFLKEFDYLSASRGDRPMVWCDSVYDSRELVPEQINYSCNTGFILSHKQMFSPDDIQRGVESAQRMKRHMKRDTGEQPLLNYLIARSHKRYGSIYDVFPHLGNEWAGILTHQIREDSTMTDSEGRELLFLHWAGFDGCPRRMPNMPYRRIWEHYRFLGSGPEKVKKSRSSAPNLCR